MSRLFRFFVIIPILFATMPLFAQKQGGEEPADSLVRLMSAESAQAYEEDGYHYRRVVGPARFLHNNTYLICDTAVWNVDTKMIDAIGHVQILQEQTVLSSDRLNYDIDLSLAQFRGYVVQLQDKDNNTLRTRHLDYYTKDSIAVFHNGGAMRDKDGQIIESRDGTYDAKQKSFTFEEDVNMFSDSVFIKAPKLLYHSEYDLAEFDRGIDAWKADNMLSANYGTYNKGSETFFFTDDVHVLSAEQEGWGDSLYFYRNTNNIRLFSNAQVTDSTHRVFAVADDVNYIDSLSKVILQKDAAIIAELNQDGQLDTLYMGADRIIYHTVPMCDISEQEIKDAQKRKGELDVDAVGEYRKKAAQAAAAEAEKAQAEQDAKNGILRHTDEEDSSETSGAGPDLSELSKMMGATGLPEGIPLPEGLALPGSPALPDSLASPVNHALTDTSALSNRLALPDSLAKADSLALPDSLAIPDSLALADSLAPKDSLAPQDSIAVPRDTTKMGFVTAIGKVRMFRENLQVRCDSLLYNDLDSLARLFKDPIVWDEINRQYSSDSIYVRASESGLEKVSLASNAFAIIQEEENFFDQIKGAEILAYFDSTNALQRFDALGGASAVFYLQENGTYATVNKVESKMLSATFVDSDIEKVFYFENPKNNAYPIMQLPKEDRQMKGFNWKPDIRPKSRYDITSKDVKPSERSRYQRHPEATFNVTEIYFPGYMPGIYRQIAIRDSLKALRPYQAPDSLSFSGDSLAVLDTLSLADSLKIAELDSLETVLPDIHEQRDSLAAVDSTLLSVSDSLQIITEQVLSEKELKAQEREKKRQDRIAAKEAKWAELDKRDAEKAAKKEARALEKKRAKTLKAYKAMLKEQAREQKLLERYQKQYEKLKEKGVDPEAKKERKSLHDRRLEKIAAKKAEQERLQAEQEKLKAAAEAAAKEAKEREEFLKTLPQREK